MSSIQFKNIKMNIFGESHNDYIGGTIEGIQAGHKINLNVIREEVEKRKPKGNISTSRKEEDDFKIISGIFNDRTTGMPITIIIENKNKKSKDYEKTKDIPRPSHSDYTAFKKYEGFNDYRGGGHFSGRLTAVFVVLGSICKSILENTEVEILGQVKSIGEIEGEDFLDVNFTKEVYENLKSNFPVCKMEHKEKFIKEIEKAKNKNDSVGGTVQIMIRGLQSGLGNPMFESVESNISKLIFGIPGVKGIEFGKGIEISKSSGSKSNDNYKIESGVVKTITNNSGGINGGITNGMEIVFTVYFRPTPSIGMEQKSFNLNTLEEVTLEIEGRHDPCIVHRGSIVVKNIIAVYVLDMYLEGV